ncbi:MAG: dihydroneopterin aldolase [Candidatus Desantisbacteria bacterium]
MKIEGVNKLPTKFIEELAKEIADRLLTRFSAKIEITVNKPNPPICYYLDYSSATVRK